MTHDAKVHNDGLGCNIKVDGFSITMTECQSPVVQRLVGLLKQEPTDFEITILYSDLPQRKPASIEDVDLEQSILLAEGHLGLDARAFPFLVREIRNDYKQCKQRKETNHELMMDSTACLLLVNPDHATGWADRRRSLLRLSNSDTNNSSKYGPSCWWRREHSYLNLLMTQHSKAPSSWAHRKYVMEKLVDKISNENSTLDKESFALIVNLVQEEIAICTRVAERYPKNYYAWTHRRYLLGQLQNLVQEANNNHMAQNFISMLQNEWSSILSWLKMHVSDHSAVHYGAQVLEFWFDSIQNDEKSVSIQVMTGALQAAKDLVDRHPDHETLWIFRRVVVVTVMRYCCSRNKANNNLQTVLAIIWNQDIEQVHKSTITDKVSLSLDRPDYAWSYIMWVLIQMRLEASTTTTDLLKSDEAVEMYSNTLAALREDKNIGHCMWQSHQTF